MKFLFFLQIIFIHMTESNYLKEKTIRPVIGFIVFYILEIIDIE